MAYQSILNPMPVSGTLAVTGTFWQATQPVSLTSTTITGSVAVTGPLTDTLLRASAVPVSLASTTITGTVTIAGALTANQSVNVSQLNGVTALMGNGVTGTGSLRVTIASDNTAFSVNAVQSGAYNITNVSGTVSLPTGASTSALQPTNAAAASTTSGQTGHVILGAVTTAAPAYTTAQSNFLSLTTAGLLRTDGSGVTQPVSLTSTTVTGTVAISAASLPLPAGAATSAKQPALGTAGTASTDVITVQGIASGVAQPVSLTSTTLTGTSAVSLATLPALVAGSAVIGALTANQSVNVSQMNGVAVTMGSGVTGTGVQRVVLATDVALPTGANVIGGVTQSGTWNIGTVTTLPALVAGSAIVGKVGIDQTTTGTTNLVVASQIIGANSTTGDTGAKTATGNGATQTNVGNSGVQILFALGTVTGTTPTFVGKVQGSVDGGTTFFDIPGATTASLTATGNWGIMIRPGIATTAGTTVSGTTATANMALPRTWRVVWTIGGTTPSFAITNVQYNYLVN